MLLVSDLFHPSRSTAAERKKTCSFNRSIHGWLKSKKGQFGRQSADCLTHLQFRRSCATTTRPTITI